MFKFSGIPIWCTRCNAYIYSTATKLLQSFSDFVIKIQQQQQVWFVERNNVICICVLVLGPNTETRLWNIESSNFSEITLRVVGGRSSHRFYFPIFWEISWGIGLFQCLSFSNERAPIIEKERLCIWGAFLTNWWHGKQCGLELEHTSLHRLGYFVWYTPKHHLPY